MTAVSRKNPLFDSLYWILTPGWNWISKQVEKHEDFSTLKILDLSDNWLKSYCQKVSFAKFELFGNNVWASAQYRPCCMEGLFFEISMSSIFGLRMSKNKMPVSWGSLVLNLCKNSFFNPLAFITLALWPSKLAKWQGPTRSMGYVLDCH